MYTAKVSVPIRGLFNLTRELGEKVERLIKFLSFRPH